MQTRETETNNKSSLFHFRCLALNPVVYLSVIPLLFLIAGVLKWCLRVNRCSALFPSQSRHSLLPRKTVFPLQISSNQSQFKSLPIMPSVLRLHSGSSAPSPISSPQSESRNEDIFASIWMFIAAVCILYLMAASSSNLCGTRQIYHPISLPGYCPETWRWEALAIDTNSLHYKGNKR